jgi:soluble lytic murein transglycosylase
MHLLSLILTSHALNPDVASALAAGDCARAVQLSPKPTEDVERLAIGRCLIRLEQPRAALDLLTPALRGSVSDYAALLAGEAGLLLGRPAEAAEVLALVKLSGESGQRAAMLQGRALIASGQYLEGRDVLRALLQTDLAKPGTIPSPGGADPAEVRWWLAEGARLRGEPALAVPVWQSLWTHNPSSPYAAQAADRLAAYDRAVPDTATQSGQQLMATRISTLKSMNLHQEALALSRLLPQDTSQAGIKSRAADAFQGRDYAAAVELYAQITAPSASQRFNHALSCSRIGDYAAAAAIYTALFETFPDHNQADFASYKLGYLSYDSGDLAEGIVLLKQHLRRYPASAHADEARWFIGWSLIRLGELDAAYAALDELMVSSPRSSLAPAARYWQARIAGMKGDEAAQTEGLERVLSTWPTSGYAWLAADRLGRTWPRQPLVTPPAPPAALAGSDWTLGVALSSVGLDSLARERLRGLRSAATTREAKLALAHALIGAGDYVTAQTLARPYCAAPWDGGDPVAMQACYPRPEGALVAHLTDAVDLDDNLPFAIMTAESALKPWVSSPAGARGLMQLMPELGAQLHTLRGYATPYHPDDLYQPGYNAALGVTELGRLRAEFGGLPQTIAGYNGGAEAVRRWMSAYPEPPDLDRFSEDVGYTETRRYVRRVLGYLQTYRYVYGD